MLSILPNLGGCTSRASLTLAQRLVIVLLLMGVMAVEISAEHSYLSDVPTNDLLRRDTAHRRNVRINITQTDDPADPLTLDESRVVMLDGNGPALLEFAAVSGDVVTIIARTLEPDNGEREARNVVVDVLDESGVRLAYNDNHFLDNDDLLPTDAAIEKLILPESGTYTIRVNTYGGIFLGEVEVTLLEADLYEAAITESDGLLTITALLPAHQRYTYMFEVAVGDVLQITARDTSGTLDPVLRLVDDSGALIAFNDDHGTASTELDVFDAMLRDVMIEAGGRYTVIVGDFLGRAGAFELEIESR